MNEREESHPILHRDEFLTQYGSDSTKPSLVLSISRRSILHGSIHCSGGTEASVGNSHYVSPLFLFAKVTTIDIYMSYKKCEANGRRKL